MAISAGETGSIGIIRNNEVFFYEEPLKRHTLRSEFDISGIEKLLAVNTVYFSVDADPAILEYAASVSEGLVIAGAGAGEFSKAFAEAIRSLTIPVVISSRIDDELITQDSVLCEGTIAANNLSPQKTAILLKLSLLNSLDHGGLLRVFSEY